MFETITDADKRGQVGIGTLIIFIAMVLVAAIAAGVLINTAGVLQSQASDTGSETQEAVANQIEVVHASGNVTSSDYGESTVDYIDLTVMKSAGSNAIDLSAMTVQYTSSTTDQTLVHGGEGFAEPSYSENTAPEQEGNVEGAYFDGTETANASVFATTDVAGDGDHDELIDTDDRVTITLFVGAIENGVEAGADDPDAVSSESGLEGGDSATIKLVDQSGAQFSYGVSVPSTFGDKKVVSV
ncbi:archaellin/type IV pilin N-terminal domain-containing protein [Halomontanus rarus]|uniref:archaellin/type IV pilin N-terminal domain-containing protein n=1 Tax=Halomontanus rarus TaxID=3034020 RepID=UPI0023E810DA|nr:archaellin/type IV pilin N-terminal domain-containing protein [Halovivax sp. TS33]